MILTSLLCLISMPINEVSARESATFVQLYQKAVSQIQATKIEGFKTSKGCSSIQIERGGSTTDLKNFATVVNELPVRLSPHNRFRGLGNLKISESVKITIQQTKNKSACNSFTYFLDPSGIYISHCSGYPDFYAAEELTVAKTKSKLRISLKAIHREWNGESFGAYNSQKNTFKIEIDSRTGQILALKDKTVWWNWGYFLIPLRGTETHHCKI